MDGSAAPAHDYNADGLRGLAALNVALSHYATMFLPILLARNYTGLYAGDPDPAWYWEALRFPLLNIFYNGHFAVVVFFVLSGYVLTLPVRFGRHDTIERRFWGRYLRLNIPAFASILLAWAAVATGAIPEKSLVLLPREAWFDVYYATGTGFWDALREGVFGAILLGYSNLNPPLWSISTEFVGSMLLLAFFLPAGRRKWITVAIVFVIGAMVYSYSVTYLVAIFAGAYIGRLRPGRAAVLTCAVLGIYMGGYQQGSIWYDFLRAEAWLPSTKQVFNLFGALLLVTAVINGFAGRLLGGRLAQFLGRVSYPLYVLHLTVLSSLGVHTYALFPPVLFQTGVHLLVYLGACLILAWLFEAIVDQPAIALSKRFARRIMPRIGRPSVTGADPASP